MPGIRSTLYGVRWDWIHEPMALAVSSWLLHLQPHSQTVLQNSNNAAEQANKRPLPTSEPSDGARPLRSAAAAASYRLNSSDGHRSSFFQAWNRLPPHVREIALDLHGPVRTPAIIFQSGVVLAWFSDVLLAA